MSQAFVIWGVTSVFKRIFQLPEAQKAGGYWAASLTVMETATATLVTVVIVLLFSRAVFFILEKPLREQSRRFVFRLRGKTSGANELASKTSGDSPSPDI